MSSNTIEGAVAYMLPIMTVHPNAAALLVSFATLIAVQLVPTRRKTRKEQP